MNPGRLIAFAIISLSLLSAIGYAITGDIRRSLYFLFGAAINLTVVWR